MTFYFNVVESGEIVSTKGTITELESNTGKFTEIETNTISCPEYGDIQCSKLDALNDITTTNGSLKIGGKEIKKSQDDKLEIVPDSKFDSNVEVSGFLKVFGHELNNYIDPLTTIHWLDVKSNTLISEGFKVLGATKFEGQIDTKDVVVKGDVTCFKTTDNSVLFNVRDVAGEVLIKNLGIGVYGDVNLTIKENPSVNNQVLIEVVSLPTNSTNTDISWNSVTRQIGLKGCSERYKENITSTSVAHSWLSNLSFKEFDWKDTHLHDYGFIAEEVFDVNPAAVNFTTSHPCMCTGIPQMKNCGEMNCQYSQGLRTEVQGINLDKIVMALVADYQERHPLN